MAIPLVGNGGCEKLVRVSGERYSVNGRGAVDTSDDQLVDSVIVQEVSQCDLAINFGQHPVYCFVAKDAIVAVQCRHET